MREGPASDDHGRARVWAALCVWTYEDLVWSGVTKFKSTNAGRETERITDMITEWF